MHVIYAIDKNNGMMFNYRRQSQDRVAIKDIVSLVNKLKGTLWLSDYSAKLFENEDVKTSNIEQLDLKKIEQNDVIFVENIPINIKNILNDNDVTECYFHFYRWDKVYPNDVTLDQSMSFDLIEFSNNCKLVEKYELTGYSHDVIDVEIWKKLS